MRQVNIAVFGDLLYDCFFWADRLPREGETVSGYASGFFAGGKGGNQAVVSARLGARTTLLGKVGGDERGKFLLERMAENGVRTDGVLVDPAEDTGTASIQVGGEGRNAIIVAPLANQRVTLAEVAAMRPRFEEADAALFQLQVNADAVEAAMELARACGAVVVLNPAPAAAVDRKLFQLADYVTPNETEAEFFSGVLREGMALEEWRERAARALNALGARRVIITMGAHGAYYSGPDEAFMMKAFAVRAVDSTAAGDAFNGALAVRLAQGATVRQAMRYAGAAGALTASRRGSMPSLPTGAEVETFLHNQEEA